MSLHVHLHSEIDGRAGSKPAGTLLKEVTGCVGRPLDIILTKQELVPRELATAVPLASRAENHSLFVFFDTPLFGGLELSLNLRAA